MLDLKRIMEDSIKAAEAEDAAEKAATEAKNDAIGRGIKRLYDAIEPVHADIHWLHHKLGKMEAVKHYVRDVWGLSFNIEDGTYYTTKELKQTPDLKWAFERIGTLADTAKVIAELVGKDIHDQRKALKIKSAAQYEQRKKERIERAIAITKKWGPPTPEERETKDIEQFGRSLAYEYFQYDRLKLSGEPRYDKVMHYVFGIPHHPTRAPLAFKAYMDRLGGNYYGDDREKRKEAYFDDIVRRLSMHPWNPSLPDGYMRVPSNYRDALRTTQSKCQTYIWCNVKRLAIYHRAPPKWQKKMQAYNQKMNWEALMACHENPQQYADAFVKRFEKYAAKTD